MGAYSGIVGRGEIIFSSKKECPISREISLFFVSDIFCNKVFAFRKSLEFISAEFPLIPRGEICAFSASAAAGVAKIKEKCKSQQFFNK